MERTSQVALIQMPFAMTSWPSLGLGMLKSALRNKGVDSTVHYFNLDFARVVGAERYEKIALGGPNNTDLLGEWIFCEALWGKDAERDADYLRATFPDHERANSKLSWTQSDRLTKDEALIARLRVAGFIESCVAQVNWSKVRIVGFTSVFQQHVASLALAKRLKTEFPHLCVIIGGANCEGSMGGATLKNFGFVDAICSGEGDIAFPDFAVGVLNGQRKGIPGILEQKSSSFFGMLSQPTESTALVQDMDALPYPDYHDFFNASPGSTVATHPLRIIFETSRGCWWGQKHHCTFCGLNGMGMAFRHKSSSRALAEVRALVDEYGAHTRKFSAADNIIPMEYFKSFLPDLEHSGLDLDLFYETKANLTEEQIAQYKRAGLKEIQPGIESLNDDSLKLMRKGVSSLQNIQLLKWCAQYGIRPYWNYLFGFPGEDPASYSGQEELISKLRHFSPPVGCASVRFDRFSPFHANPSDFGITELNPYPSYRHIYSELPLEELSNLAYYFVGEFSGKAEIGTYTKNVSIAVSEWRDSAASFSLFHCGDERISVIFDSRDKDTVKIFVLRGVQNAIFLSCAAIKTVQSVKVEMKSEYGDVVTEKALQSLLEARIISAEKERLLALSVPLGYGYCVPENARRSLSAHIGQDMEDFIALSIPADKFIEMETML